MPPVVLTPLGMSGVELVQDMMVGEEGREQGREQGCTLGEEVEAAVEGEVEEEEEGEGEECCEWLAEGGCNIHPGRLVCRNVRSRRDRSSLQYNSELGTSRHSTIRSGQDTVHWRGNEYFLLALVRPQL